MRFKWMWRRRKQTQNCAALLYLSTRADIFKHVNHRNLRCSALRGLRCKTVSGTLCGAGRGRRRTVLPCPPSQLVLTYWNMCITENCTALPCMGCIACVSMCAWPNSALHTCWWRKCCVAISVNTAYVDERNTVCLSLWALRMLIKETLCGWNFKTRCAKCKKHQDMGKTFRILVRYKMKYCEYSVHKLNDCFWVY